MSTLIVTKWNFYQEILENFRKTTLPRSTLLTETFSKRV